MRPEEPQRLIAAAVEQKGQQSVEALATRFGVSTETIRRNLALLVSRGAVQKVHGGARTVRSHKEGSFEERMAEDAPGQAGHRAEAGRADPAGGNVVP